jgi:methylisocitrate lyase
LPNALDEIDFAVVPGIYNPFTALLAERAGAKAIYLSGASLTSSLGIPDIGLITLDELEFMVRRIKEVCQLPLIVDADTGFGEALGVHRAVMRLERAGADAIQIEDQSMPKKCGHLDGKVLVEEREMLQKIRAAIDARKEALIIARTDARAVEGVEAALRRARAYAEAGADIVFPEALLSEEEFALFPKNVGRRCLANMTEFGKTPYIEAEKFRGMGYSFVIFPVTLLRVSARAEMNALEELLSRGTQKGLLWSMITRAEQYEIIRYNDYRKRDDRFAGII